ncbi:MAG: AMP-binding protein [Proteobacteria bacterium]|nr:AMP-binding protein [Pseudomonadota bacterium]
METLSGMLARNVRLLGNRPFLITDEGSLTYAEFDRRVSRLAHVLAEHGLRKGMPVGLYLPSDGLMAVGFWASQKLGAIPVPMSSMYRAPEVAGIVERTEMSAMIVDADTWEELKPVAKSLPKLRHVLVAGEARTGATRLDPLLAAAPEHFQSVDAGAEDIAALFFTSGTTGVPKGTMQTQFNQYSSLRDMMAFHQTQFGAEIYMCAVPLFTNYGMTVNLNLCMYAGGTLVLHPRWDTRRVLDAVRQHRCTYLCGTPTMFVYLVREYDAARDDLSSLRLCTTGGAPVPQEVMQRFETLTGAPVLQVYGATESTGQCVIEPLYGVRKPGSSGVPVGSSRVEIVDDDGNTLPSGKVGEVVLAGDTIAKGYWRDPEATAQAFTRRGWLSGDLGYLDEDGYLFIVDRKKDVIIAGGYNILPVEVETVLYRHPAVAVCAVVGIPDEAKGEIPVGVVQLGHGSAADAAELIAFCRAQLSAYKAPRRIYFIDEMPLRAGKIRKRELVDWIRGGRLVSAD